MIATGTRTARAAALAASVALLLTSCGGGDEGAQDGPTTTAATSPSSSAESSAGPSGRPSVATAAVEGVVARDLEVPWGLTFLPDGSALVSERDTRLVQRVAKDGSVTELGEVRGVDGGGEGGLLGLAASPDFGSDRTVYAYFTAGDENVIERMPVDGDSLGDQERVFGGIPAGSIHNGGRIAFGPDGMLYVGTGEAGRLDPAQDRDDLGGKILRLTPDGDPAPDNPFDGSPVYSLGHRNVQGLAWDDSGQLWASEFGQNTWDELNRIEPGANYGWPQVEGRQGDGRYVDPARQWRTDVASPSGIAFAGGSIFMAALRGARLWQVPVAGGKAGEPRDQLTGEYGRLRTVAAAPDGSLWVATSNRDGRGSPGDDDDRIIRLTLT